MMGQGDVAPNNRRKRRRPIFTTVILIICVLLLILCIALAIFSGVTYNKLQNAKKEEESICHSAVCVEDAAQILEKLNPAVKPCDNFYDFACGKYIKRTVVPEDETIVTVIQTMQNDVLIDLKKLIEPPISPDDTEVIVNVKNLYASCMSDTMDESSVDVLRALLERVGRWPIADDLWTEQDTDMERRLAILFVHSIEPFIQGTVDEDEKNETDYILDISSGELILDNLYYLNTSSPDHVKYVNSYKQMIIGAARLLGGDESIIQKDVEDMIEFETDYAGIAQAEKKYWKRRANLNTTDQHDSKRYTVSKLEKIIPEIKWGRFLDKIFEIFKLKDQKEDVIITLQHKKYFRNLAILLRNTKPRTLANYLTWRLLYKLLPTLDIHFRRLYYDFHKEVPLDPHKQIQFTRWKECIRLVKGGLEVPLTSLYVKDNFDEHLQDEIIEIFKPIKKGFIAGIKQQNWMDPKARALAEQKAQKMKKRIEYPRFALKVDKLAKDYKGLNITRDNLLTNVLRVKRHKVAAQLSKLTGKTRREVDGTDQPLKVNAFYAWSKNKVIFPLAVLRSPIFVSGRPKFSSYATLGTVASRLMTHGFDTMGFYIDPEGIYKDWWKPETEDNFRKRVSCFIDQYSKLRMNNTREKVDPERTIDDDICDNAGLRNAYRAYTKFASHHEEEPRLPGVSYTNAQVFFIKFTQLYCEVVTKEGSETQALANQSPGMLRTNIPLQNSPEFSAAFNCPRGSPMNPEKKCSLWS